MPYGMVAVDSNGLAVACQYFHGWKAWLCYVIQHFCELSSLVATKNWSAKIMVSINKCLNH